MKRLIFSSDIMYLSFECEDKLSVLVNGQTVKTFDAVFVPVGFEITAQPDQSTVEYLNSEIR